MKREFGTKLIEDFLVNRDLRLVADTSGAYIPGHGTPTVIIIGRNQPPVGPSIHTVLGIRSESERPDNPAKGRVWTSIVEHADDPVWDDSWITITDLDRTLLATHPWSLSGGGAVHLLNRVHVAPGRLGARVKLIGRTCHTGADDAYFAHLGTWARFGVASNFIVPLVRGDAIRDWHLMTDMESLFPYDQSFKASLGDAAVGRLLWKCKSILSDRHELGGTHEEIGLTWFEYSRWHPERFVIPLGIAFAFVATHNQFALDRGGKVFKQTAPVIKLPEGATEEEHLELLAVLNSSTACFWLKQNSHNKGRPGAEQAGADEPWEHRYEFTATTLEEYPLPAVFPLKRGKVLDELAGNLALRAPSSLTANCLPVATALAEAQTVYEEIRARMVAVQEELDWEVYRLYGLIDGDLTYGGDDLPRLAPGERAFAIALARDVVSGEISTTWFTHHNHKHTPVTEIPAHWPSAYRDLVQRRLDLIASNPSIRLLEKPEYKRRWAQEPWERRQERALREWLLDRVEERRFWFDPQGRPLPRSVAQLADDVTRDADTVSVLELWEGRPDVPVTQSLVRLLADEAVPYLAAYRYKESGLRKREAWEETWRLQRREDAGEKVGLIAVPPKYTSADFRKHSYWQARGKLDVQKERFILYPDAGRETDPTPLLGWAGWDHAQQSLALSLIIGEREKDGWADDRLVPLVAGLAELQPWVDQWHAEVDPDYGVSLAAFCNEQLTARAAQVGKTLDELAAWRPSTTRGRRAHSAEGAQ
jgi:hypothetical protein